MIRSVHLQNFQSHKDTLLEFSPDLNVIIGQSDSGKTSILRAIRWVAENRPAGDEFRSHWTGKGIGENHTKVIIKLDDKIITRVKGSTYNSYILNAEQFQGFGQDVPQPVKQALSLSPINLQFQMDSPFLLMESPGAVARYLNELVNLDKIDSSLSGIAGKKRQTEMEKQGLEMRLTDLEHSASLFPDLVATEEFITSLEARNRKANQNSQTAATIQSLLTSYKQTEEKLGRIKLPDEARLSELITKEERLRSIKFTRDSLQELITQEKGLGEAIKKLTIPGPLKTKIAQVLDMNAQAQRTGSSLKRVNSMLTPLRGLEIQMGQLSAIIRQKEREIKERMPNICPLCGK